MFPMPHQVADVQKLRAHNYTGLLNIEPGGGKTASSLFAARDSGAERILIIAPDATHRSAWMPTVEAILGQEARTIGGTGKAKKAALADMNFGYPGVYLTTPQLLTRADISDWAGDLLITDEGHLLNNAKAKGQRKWSGYNASGSDNPISNRFGMRMFLSGTSWRNSFERAWATMRYLWPEYRFSNQIAYDNYFGWLNQRMTFETIYTNQRNPDGTPKQVKQFLNEKVPGQLIAEAPCVITHFRRERCCDFHPAGFLPTDAPQEIREVIELAPAQKKAIKELEDHYMTYLDNQPFEVDLTLTQQQRIRQLALGVPKLEFYMGANADGEEVEKVRLDFEPDCTSPFTDRLFDILEELDDEPVVVYMESQRFASVLVQKLNKKGVTAFEYSGATAKTRDEMLAGFGTRYRVAVVVLAAGGTGLDGIQKVTKTEVWFERSVDETVNQQGEARADRMGGIGQVQRYFFLDSEGRAEGRMGEQLEKRRALAKTLRRVA
ncbi:DNA helicase [Microbacterium phage Lifes]|nr:DNA helicase [Microbacterium phage Lifes]